MTDIFEPLSDEPATGVEPSFKDTLQEERVTIELPTTIVSAIQQQGQQSGRSQMEVILEVLQAAFKGAPEIAPPLPPPVVPATPEAAQHSSVADLQAEINHLKMRLAQLEPLISKVEQLEGKSIAF
ncbi:MAG: hypothetical protein Kow00121_36230 [Elainellaceae cyanobacterium]